MAIKKQLEHMKADISEAHLEQWRIETEDQTGLCATAAELEAQLQKAKGAYGLKEVMGLKRQLDEMKAGGGKDRRQLGDIGGQHDSGTLSSISALEARFKNAKDADNLCEALAIKEQLDELKAVVRDARSLPTAAETRREASVRA